MTATMADTRWPLDLPNDACVPVALSASVETATSSGVCLGGKELAVWRDDAGDIHAWEDRCPHRGMRLSLGFVKGDHIACLYHGWQYDTAGRCRYIPAHPKLDVPKSITVQSYCCFEWADMIWVDMSRQADPSMRFQLPAPAVMPVRSLYLDVSASNAEALLCRALPSVLSLPDGETIVIEALSSNLLATRIGGGRLLLGLHALGPSRCALHVVILKDDCYQAVVLRTRLLLQLPALRHAAKEMMSSYS